MCSHVLFSLGNNVSIISLVYQIHMSLVELSYDSVLIYVYKLVISFVLYMIKLFVITL